MTNLACMSPIHKNFKNLQKLHSNIQQPGLTEVTKVAFGYSATEISPECNQGNVSSPQGDSLWAPSPKLTSSFKALVAAAIMCIRWRMEICMWIETKSIASFTRWSGPWTQCLQEDNTILLFSSFNGGPKFKQVHADGKPWVLLELDRHRLQGTNCLHSTHFITGGMQPNGLGSLPTTLFTVWCKSHRLQFGWVHSIWWHCSSKTSIFAASSGCNPIIASFLSSAFDCAIVVKCCVTFWTYNNNNNFFYNYTS